MKLLKALGASLIVALCAGEGAASAACRLQQRAEYPVTFEGGRPLVEVSINRRPVWFLVDTRSPKTFLFRGFTDPLGLEIRQMGGADPSHASRPEDLDETTVDEFKVGSTMVRNIDILVLGSPGRGKYAGVIGQDILSRGDLELDFANGVMRVFTPTDCEGGQVVYWKAERYSTAAISLESGSGKLDVEASIGGKTMLASLATLAPVSVVTTTVAQEAKARLAPAGVDLTDPLGGPTERAGTWMGLFPALSIGDEVIKGAPLHVTDTFATDPIGRWKRPRAEAFESFTDMLLGDDFLRAHHVYFARSQGKMYFSYNGGPIFRSSAGK